jgi:hypothetical protein
MPQTGRCARSTEIKTAASAAYQTGPITAIGSDGERCPRTPPWDTCRTPPRARPAGSRRRRTGVGRRNLAWWPHPAPPKCH